MIKTEDSRRLTSLEGVKRRRKKAVEPEPLLIPMSPEAAAIIHAHLPEPWVERAKFVGEGYAGLRSAEGEEIESEEKEER